MDVTGQAARVGTRCHFGTLLPRWHNFPVAISELLSLISYSNDIGTATTAERYVRSVNVIGCTSSDRWPIADVTAACLGDGRQISVIFRWLLDVSFSIGQNRVRHTGAAKPPTAPVEHPVAGHPRPIADRRRGFTFLAQLSSLDSRWALRGFVAPGAKARKFPGISSMIATVRLGRIPRATFCAFRRLRPRRMWFRNQCAFGDWE